MKIYFKDMAEYHQTLKALGLNNDEEGRQTLHELHMMDCREDAFEEQVLICPDIYKLDSDDELLRIRAHDEACSSGFDHLPETYVKYVSFAIDENNRPYMTVEVMP